MKKRKQYIRKPGLLYQICRNCGEEWNVAKGQVIPKYGYICPVCSYSKSGQIKRAAGTSDSQ